MRASSYKRADFLLFFTKYNVPAARQRYSEGAIDFPNIVSTQALLLQSENDLADSDTGVVVNLVNPYRALGGG